MLGCPPPPPHTLRAHLGLLSQEPPGGGGADLGKGPYHCSPNPYTIYGATEGTTGEEQVSIAEAIPILVEVVPS